MKFVRLLLLPVWLALLPCMAPARELADWVNPFIGTQESPASEIKGYWASGCCFPGAVVPFGLMQFSPDTVKRIPGGYDYSDHRIRAFSLTHFSGRGFLYMQDIGVLPVAGLPVASPPAAPQSFFATFSHANESAAPGFYQVRLDSGLTVGLTATPRTGMMRVAFPAGADTNSLLFDLGNNLNGTVAAGVQIIGDHALAGWVQSRVGSGAELYKVYFYATFDHPFAASGTWTGPTLTADSTAASGPKSGAYVAFAATGGKTVQAKIALSFTSITNAAANLTMENGGKWNFEAVRKTARALWNQKLDAIEVRGSAGRDLTVFYTALYHCLIHPNILDDVDGAYPGIDGAVHRVKPGHHHYTHFDGWGLYKTRAPLQGLLYPAEASDMVQSLVDDARQDSGGGIPRWNQVNRNSNGMVGDGNVAVIAALNAFGATNFDVAQAAQAMQRNAGNPTTTSDGHKVRPHLEDYLSLGFVPEEADEHGAADTLEYAITDMALGYFLRANGDAAAAGTYLRRGGNWTNLFNADAGCILPKKRDGAWAAQDRTSALSWAEGTSSQYTWNIPPAELGNLVQALGRDQARTLLDKFFTKLDTGPGSPYAYMGNEPCEGAPYVYEFLGCPARTEATVRRIERELFTAEPGGMPGQDDGGGLASWFVFSALGFYPAVPGAAGCLVGCPLFPQADIKSEDGRRWRILAPGAGAADAYVASLKIDGQADRSLWVPLSRLSGPAVHKIQFRLGPTPDPAWGTGLDNLPSQASF